MRHPFLLLTLLVALFGCGDSAVTSFEGDWNGSFTSLQNDCPFSVASDINPLFPMNVSIDASDVYTVVAINGSIATGGQGQGEKISFLAQSDDFGNYGSIAPYSCQSTQSDVGYLSNGTNNAQVTVTIYFNSCSTPETVDSPISCGVIYFGDAVRVQ